MTTLLQTASLYLCLSWKMTLPLPDDNATEILEIVDWHIEMNSTMDDLSAYDWSLSLPSSDGPFRRGSNQFTFTPHPVLSGQLR